MIDAIRLHQVFIVFQRVAKCVTVLQTIVLKQGIIEFLLGGAFCEALHACGGTSFGSADPMGSMKTYVLMLIARDALSMRRNGRRFWRAAYTQEAVHSTFDASRTKRIGRFKCRNMERTL